MHSYTPGEYYFLIIAFKIVCMRKVWAVSGVEMKKINKKYSFF